MMFNTSLLKWDLKITRDFSFEKKDARCPAMNNFKNIILKNPQEPHDNIHGDATIYV